MKVSIVPSWVQKASAFAVAAVTSAAMWPWGAIVDPNLAVHIVGGLGFAKLALEFLTDNAPVEPPSAGQNG